MQPKIIRRDQHPISRKDMPEEVLKVLYRLHRCGHLAYLCGGGVRDLLLARDAGDFDVATDAEPRQLKEVFGNCRLVGRRFRIAHILFKGGKIIEVSTFRKKSEENGEGEENEESLLIKRDNTFGTPAEDAFRRDFTVNALYYNIADFSLIDYVGGRADLQTCLIRCIGDPDIRFQEDPIRILRGIRLAASLDFQVEEQTWEAMIRQRYHLVESAVPRIREELMKILQRGNTGRAFHLLSQAGILEILLPKLHGFLHFPQDDDRLDPGLFWDYLATLDRLRQENECLSDALFLATLTAAPVSRFLENLPSGSDVGKCLHEYLEETFKPLAFPRLIRGQTHLLHLALRHMLRTGGRRRRNLRTSPLFDEALKFLEIHCRATNQFWSKLDRWQHSPRQPRRRRGRRPVVSTTQRTS